MSRFEVIPVNDRFSIRDNETGDLMKHPPSGETEWQNYHAAFGWAQKFERAAVTGKPARPEPYRNPLLGMGG